MAECCNENDAHLVRLRERQTRILWMVLAINAGMFLLEFTAGWFAQSTALLADSLDMLGDALVYGLSLFVVDQGVRAKARAAGFKGSFMLVFGLLVAAQAVAKALYGLPPQSWIMAGVGTLALAANIGCLVLLTRHRDDDVNMGSAWICSRNDLFANSGVILAAGLVTLTNSVWPDVIIGMLIAALFLRSAFGVIGNAIRTYRDSLDEPAGGARVHGRT